MEMRTVKADTESADRADAPHVVERERAFWDEHVPALDQCLREYESGPDPNTARMLDAVAPLAGRRVLDFGCGAGVTSAWLAQRGATVTGIDISPASIERARELAQHAGLTIELMASELTPSTFPAESFDAVVGRYVLHHIDLTAIAPIIDRILVPGGKGAFLETIGLNPLLRFCRRWLAGRAGVASYGSEDERPISHADLDVLRRTIGEVSLEVGQMTFLRILDRNVLRFRVPRVSALLGTLDDRMLRFGMSSWSYHQVVTVTKARERA
jgi:2-polyprenyl-3-methyl-5-hydroxy-6-metoxy-1,4-benzoquinol methylase